MGTLTGLMALTRSALDADQQAINVTANNVSNQNTAGYTREVASFQSNDTVSLNGFQSGSESVSVTVVSQRDRVLEQMLQQQASTSSQTSARLTALQSAQSQFGLTSTSGDASSTALGSAISNFFSSLTSLTGNPTDTPTRQAVLSAAQSLASSFNSSAQNLNTETSTLNSQIADAAQQINSLTSSLAKLNAQITALSPNQDAGTLEDQRQQDILQLSKLVGVNQISNEDNGITLTTSSGAVLVSGNASFSVSTASVNGNSQLSVGNPPVALSSADGGSVGGMMQARDQDIPSMLSSLDQLANALGNAVNTQNQSGQTSSGIPGSVVFSLPSAVAGSAAGISVSLTSVDGIATAANGEGSAGTGNATALQQLSSKAIVNGESASNFFADFIGQVGNAVSSATTDNNTASTALTQAQTARDTLSGVSLDEEASSLSQYQRSYEAAAKVFSIVNQIMADTINLGQQTTVS